MHTSNQLVHAAKLVFLTTIFFCNAAVGQQSGKPLPDVVISTGATVSQAFPATRSSIDLSFNGIARASVWGPGDPIKEIPRQLTRPVLSGLPDVTNPVPTTPDSLLDSQFRASRQPVIRTLMEPDLNMDGQGFSGVNPPDTVGDVGRQYYIQMINGAGGSRFTIYDKITGDIVVPSTDLDSLGTGVCANGIGDPIVLYDQIADRWIMSEFAPRGDDTLCVYVSITSDPTTGGWFAYNFQANSFPDYPKYAVWPDAYYLASNESNPTVYAFDREAMLAGNPATIQSFTAPALSGFGFQSLQPSDLGGSNQPSEGAPNYFLRHQDDEVHDPANNDPSADYIELFEFHVDFNDAGNSTFTGPFTVPITNIDSDLCGLSSFSCFDQPSGLNPLDPLREVVMWRVQYRKFQDYETLVGNMVTDVNGSDQGGIRWFELRRNSGQTSWQLFQEGTYAPDSLNRWMGSIAMDKSGNIALAYSAGSSSVSAGLRYTGRMQNDPTGAMVQPETVIVDGVGSSASVRWGDYSSLNLDPDDDCTFWYTGEYAFNNAWQTRIARFSFDTCDQPTAGINCENRPWLCGMATFEDNLLELECWTRDCFVFDPIPKNCLVKWECPACQANGLCPPFYNIYLEDINTEWNVSLLDVEGKEVNHKSILSGKSVVLSFRPKKDAYIDGQIGDYILAFRMKKEGTPGKKYRIKSAVKSSDDELGRNDLLRLFDLE